MIIDVQRFLTGFMAVFLSALPQIGAAQSDIDSHVINIYLEGDTADHKQMADKFSFSVLQVLESDLAGDSESPVNYAFSECDKTNVYPDNIRDWLNGQIRYIQSEQNRLLLPPDAPAETHEGMPIAWDWTSSKMGRPTMVLLKLEDRRAHFYSETHGVDKRKPWTANSPACPASDCPEDTRKNQIPLWQQSKVLMMMYLWDELDKIERRPDHLIVTAVLQDLLAGQHVRTLSEKHKIDRMIAGIDPKCEHENQ